MRIVWDERKRTANVDKHAMDFAELDEGFLATAVIQPSYAGRYRALGRLADGRLASMVFRPLGTEAISIISLRPASLKERRLL